MPTMIAALKRAVEIAEQIQKLEGELAAIFNQGAAASEAGGSPPASKSRKKKRIVSRNRVRKWRQRSAGGWAKKKAQ